MKNISVFQAPMELVAAARNKIQSGLTLFFPRSEESCRFLLRGFLLLVLIPASHIHFTFWRFFTVQRSNKRSVNAVKAEVKPDLAEVVGVVTAVEPDLFPCHQVRRVDRQRGMESRSRQGVTAHTPHSVQSVASVFSLELAAWEAWPFPQLETFGSLACSVGTSYKLDVFG